VAPEEGADLELTLKVDAERKLPVPAPGRWRQEENLPLWHSIKVPKSHDSDAGTARGSGSAV
jgi:hypothetical protein